ncbi:hypothetical protein PM8797T_05655 [Gimesia maris DSM 8797]|jgi:hypothetical protein|nr:hypothetical protein PM8797T_05655 [Gimesia maris DSM 8797]
MKAGKVMKYQGGNITEDLNRGLAPFISEWKLDHPYSVIPDVMSLNHGS